MNAVILSMLGRYKCVTAQDYENALKEIMQEVALLGLWRSKFFEHAAFYGTSLRILFGLDRFSEDLDFSLLSPNLAFDLQPQIVAVQAELNGMGFNVTVEEREKNIATSIESAFIKAGTKEHLLLIQAPESTTNRVLKNQVMKVKLEVDVDPPSGFNTESRTLLQPIPFAINTYSPPDLFAGKIHAVLQRQWKKRVKGREYYDFVWYIGRNIPLNLHHLESRLRQSGGWTERNKLTLVDLNRLLEKRFSELDISAAQKDVAPFLRDPNAVDIWSNEFFISLLPRLTITG